MRRCHGSGAFVTRCRHEKTSGCTRYDGLVVSCYCRGAQGQHLNTPRSCILLIFFHQTVYDQVIPVDRITNRSPANLYLMNRPDLIGTFTKIALWRQTQFTRVVYIDADVVALRAPDELFTIEAPFAAVTDIGWPDCFNTGVMVLTPYMGDYYALLALAQRGISFDGADQGLLNMHFRNWERLSFAYNCTPSAHYQYVPAYRHFQSSINMVHFIGSDKPWTVGREGRGAAGVYDELLGRWWSVYERHYRATVIRSYMKFLESTANIGTDYCVYFGTDPVYDENCSATRHRRSTDFRLRIFYVFTAFSSSHRLRSCICSTSAGSLCTRTSSRE